MKRTDSKSEAMRQTKRPPLTPKTRLKDFRNFYWYLKELVLFCRKHGLPTGGQKHELVSRIETFLTTGKCVLKRETSLPRSRRKPGALSQSQIALDSPVTEDFKCDQRTRAFFKSVIGDHFHFTAHVQQFRRTRQFKRVPLTYGDLAREWIAERERRKNPHYKSKIARTWQYNQFVRDFMADKQRNRGKGIGEAARAWNAIRVHCGPHSYAEYLRLGEVSGAGAA